MFFAYRIKLLDWDNPSHHAMKHVAGEPVNRDCTAFENFAISSDLHPAADGWFQFSWRER
jgi:hypothetical protein